MERIELLQNDFLQVPKMYKVVLLNDDVTTMEFVIDVLMKVFFHDLEKAEKIMYEVHNNGSAVCGIYPQEIALSKQRKLQKMASEANFPLQSMVEEE